MKFLYSSLYFLFICILTISSLFAQNPDTNEQKTSEKQIKNKQIRLVLKNNLSSFIEEINDLGKNGYYAEKAFNFGDSVSNSQNFAAILKYVEKTTYEYDWLTSPNKNYLESRLNARAEDGFYPIHSFAITECDDNEYKIDNSSVLADSPLLRLTKGDIFLLVRKNRSDKKIRDYKVVTAKIGMGKSPTKTLQAALDKMPRNIKSLKSYLIKGDLRIFLFQFCLKTILIKKHQKRLNTNL